MFGNIPMHINITDSLPDLVSQSGDQPSPQEVQPYGLEKHKQ